MASGGKIQDHYILQRDYDASARLFGQQFLLTKRTGWLIHPKAQPLAEGPGARIADVGTGNGIWASELAIVYPHAHIVGLDMSDQQYPPAWTHPANLSFDMYNVLEPPPDKFRGMFDIVHVRLIAGGMRSEADFERAVGHLGELLKPGGYLQWQDVVLPGWQMIDQSLVVDMNDRALPQFAKTFDRALGGIIEKRMTFQLDELAGKDGNFGEVESVMPAVVPRLLKYETDFAAKSFEETLNGSKAMLMAKGGMTEEKGRLFDESQRLLAEYMGNGGLISYKTVVVVGRKVCAQQD